MKIILGLLAAALAASGAHAADAPEYRPQGAWVKAVAIPKSKPEHEDGEGLVLLQDVQTRFGPDEDEYFRETAVKLLTAKGLSDGGNMILSWRPDTETLVIHKLQVLRGGQTIDLLAGGKTFTVLRRETNLEMAMLDGALTATLQPEGLQIGDTVDMAYTLRSHDPVLAGRSGDWAYLARPGVVGRAYFRSIWPKNKPMRWRSTEGLAQGRVSDTADGRELVFDMTDVEAPHPPQGAPLRFGYMGQLQLSDFASWTEVSTLSAPLYEKASALASNSPLHAEADKIKAVSSDPKVRAMAALKLVEDKVRYLYLGLNNGGYVPADADLTWTRRFGDCKAKTALLLALLRELGIDAHPTLVNTEQGDGLDQRLPSMDAFDHVVVRATIGGKAYWMDGTRIGDTRLDDLATPNFYWTLPVQAAGGALEKLQPTLYPDPLFETRLTLDASTGLDMPASAHVEHIFRGASGLGLQLQLESVSKGELDRDMRTYWRKVMPWIEPKQVVFSRNEAHDVTLSMDGAASMNWSKDSDGRDFFFDDSAIGYNASFQREPGPNKDAPFAIGYPAFIKRTVRVTLPGKGKSFLLMNSFPVDKVVAGVGYHRVSRLEDGVAVIEMSQRSIGPEFPAAEAPAATATLRDWAVHPVGLRAGIVKTTSDAQRCEAAGAGAIAACNAVIEAVKGDKTKLAWAYFGRGLVRYKASAWDEAIKDYNLALTADSGIAAPYNGRGAAHMQKRQYAQAVADFTVAIQLDAGEPAYVINRALSYGALNDHDNAVKDFTAALKTSPKAYALYYDRGEQYFDLGEWPAAIDDFSQALAAKPDLMAAYGYRGRAYDNNRQFNLAIADYDRVLAAKPDDWAFLRNRGLVYGHMGDLTRAIADYDRALAVRPDYVDALNSRGFAFQTLGQFNKALADYDKAVVLNPSFLLTLRNRADTQLAMGRPDKAIDDLNNVLRYDARNMGALMTRARAYMALHDSARAILDFDAAIAVNTRSAQAWAMRGQARLQIGLTDAGLGDLDYALSLDPANAFAMEMACRERTKHQSDPEAAASACVARLRDARQSVAQVRAPGQGTSAFARGVQPSFGAAATNTKAATVSVAPVLAEVSAVTGRQLRPPVEPAP